MRRSSPTIRIPIEDYKEIKKVQADYNVSFMAACQIWKKLKFPST